MVYDEAIEIEVQFHLLQFLWFHLMMMIDAEGDVTYAIIERARRI